MLRYSRERDSQSLPDISQNLQQKLEELNDGEITLYKQGNFTDLCKGPHIPSSEKIKAIKLLNIEPYTGPSTRPPLV